jgi:hypothetical protein
MPKPPAPAQPSLFDQIIAFFAGIISFFLSLLGLAIVRNKRSGNGLARVTI